jgi:hypothetical protein
MCKIQLKLHLKLTLRANTINNEMCTPTFIGSVVSESLNTLSFTYELRKIHTIPNLIMMMMMMMMIMLTSWTTRQSYFDCRQGQFSLFSKEFTSDLEPTLLPVVRYWGLLHRGYSGRSLKLTTHYNLVPRLRTRVAKLPLPMCLQILFFIYNINT